MDKVFAVGFGVVVTSVVTSALAYWLTSKESLTKQLKQGHETLNKCEEEAEAKLVELENVKKIITSLSLTKETRSIHELLATNARSKPSPDNTSTSGLQGGYYHFNSRGERIPSKWDNFDYDEELVHPDGESQSETSFMAQLLKAQEAVGKLKHELEAIQLRVDAVPADIDDPTIRERKKKICSDFEEKLFREVEWAEEDVQKLVAWVGKRRSNIIDDIAFQDDEDNPVLDGEEPSVQIFTLEEEEGAEEAQEKKGKKKQRKVLKKTKSPKDGAKVRRKKEGGKKEVGKKEVGKKKVGKKEKGGVEKEAVVITESPQQKQQQEQSSE